VRRHAKASFAGSTLGSGIRRGRLGLICLCVLGLAAFLGSSAPSAGAQACPNEAFRNGPSAFLPGCRAYELVNPAEMEGQEVSAALDGFSPPPTSSPDGETVGWGALGAFGEATSSPANSMFLSRRGADWSSEEIMPPIDPYATIYIFTSFGFSENLDKWAFEGALEPPLTPGATSFAPNLYVRDNTSGSYELMTPGLPEVELFLPTEFWSDNSPWGMSADAGHVIYRALLPVTGDCVAPAVSPPLCDWNAATGTVSLVGRAPVTNEVLTSGNVTLANRNYRRPISADGSRIFFKGGGEGCGVCVRINGATTQLVSETGSFEFASSDGSIAYVTEGGELKRYNVAADELGPSIAGEVQGVLGTSADGSIVYFVSDEGGENSLYMWSEGGGTKFIAAGNGSGDFTANWAADQDGPNSRVTPDGMHLAFQANNSLTGFPDNGKSQAYIYSAATGALVCASCNVAEPADGAFIEGGTNYQISRLSRNLSNDGSRLFFVTDEALVPRDSNGLEDVYVYEAGSGAAALISPGNDNCSYCGLGRNNYFGDASASGDDAFFWSRDELVGVDQNENLDIYDARVGGGLTSQNPPPPAPPCTGDECRGQSSSPDLPGAASAGFVGKGNVSQKQNCNKLGREAKKLSNRAKRLRKNAKTAKRNGKSAVAKKRNKKANRLAKQARNKSKSAKKCRQRNRGASK